MNKQEVFNRVAEHLLTQKMKSYNTAEQMCVYRDGMGHSCAIGALIPDELYKSEMEGSRVQSLMVEYSEIRKLFEGVDPQLLTQLQTLHDNFLVGEWKKELRFLGEHYKLDISVLDKFQ